jgi:acyl-coenzyme A thioesterase PaaI-like protein
MRSRLQDEGMTMTEERVMLQQLEGRHCFACGTANPVGLKMRFYRNGNAVYSDIRLGKDFEGWENMAHGGIISTILDEVMSWAIICFRRTLFVTRKMELKYVRPVPLNTFLRARGRVMDEDRGPLIKTRGELFDDAGRILARSVGEFALVTEEKLADVPETVKAEMLTLFERMS